MNDSMKQNVSQCSADFYQFPFVFGTVVVSVLTLLSLPIQLIFLKIVWNPGALHANVRFMFINYSLAALMKIGHCLLLVIYHVLLKSSLAFVSVLGGTCATFSAVQKVSSLMEIFSVLALAVERFLATWKKKFQDPDKSAPLLKGCVAFTWLCAIAITGAMIVQ